VLYRPSSTAPQPQPSSNADMSGGLDSYWYAETLPAAAAALAGEPKMLSAAVIWLEQWAESTPYAKALMSRWRQSITADEQARRMEPVGSALVDAIRDISQTQIDAGRPLPEVVAQVERGRGSIFPRISLHMITHALNRARACHQEMGNAGAVAAPDAEVVAIAYERLATPALLAGEYQPEYVLLARAALQSFSTEQLEQWERLIAEPPHLTAEQLARMLGGRGGKPAEIAADDVARHVGMWQRDLLAGIGREALPEGLQKQLDDLIAAHGEPPDLGEFQARAPSLSGQQARSLMTRRQG